MVKGVGKTQGEDAGRYYVKNSHKYSRGREEIQYIHIRFRFILGLLWAIAPACFHYREMLKDKVKHQ
jgi:hypothetical protein